MPLIANLPPLEEEILKYMITNKFLPDKSKARFTPKSIKRGLKNPSGSIDNHIKHLLAQQYITKINTGEYYPVDFIVFKKEYVISEQLNVLLNLYFAEVSFTEHALHFSTILPSQVVNRIVDLVKIVTESSGRVPREQIILLLDDFVQKNQILAEASVLIHSYIGKTPDQVDMDHLKQEMSRISNVLPPNVLKLPQVSANKAFKDSFNHPLGLTDFYFHQNLTSTHIPSLEIRFGEKGKHYALSPEEVGGWEADVKKYLNDKFGIVIDWDSVVLCGISHGKDIQLTPDLIAKYPFLQNLKIRYPDIRNGFFELYFYTKTTGGVKKSFLRYSLEQHGLNKSPLPDQKVLGVEALINFVGNSKELIYNSQEFKIQLQELVTSVSSMSDQFNVNQETIEYLKKEIIILQSNIQNSTQNDQRHKTLISNQVNALRTDLNTLINGNFQFRDGFVKSIDTLRQDMQQSIATEVTRLDSLVNANVKANHTTLVQQNHAMRTIKTQLKSQIQNSVNGLKTSFRNSSSTMKILRDRVDDQNQKIDQNQAMIEFTSNDLNEKMEFGFNQMEEQIESTSDKLIQSDQQVLLIQQKFHQKTIEKFNRVVQILESQTQNQHDTIETQNQIVQFQNENHHVSMEVLNENHQTSMEVQTGIQKTQQDITKLLENMNQQHQKIYEDLKSSFDKTKKKMSFFIGALLVALFYFMIT
jgi:hypothetical protein